DGIPCDDGDICTQSDTCVTGNCVGSDLTICDDANPCTTDTCDPADGCTFENITGPCDDGDLCTEGDTCSGGACDELSFTLTQGAFTLALQPLQGTESIVDFYQYATPNAASANTGYEVSDHATLILHEDPSGELGMAVILDKPTDGSGGHAVLGFDGLDSVNFVVGDEPYESYDSSTGNISWSWVECCTDGAAIAPLPGGACFTITPKVLNGITQIDIVNQDGSRIALPSLTEPIHICSDCVDEPGFCIGGDPLDCDDTDPCTTDSCSPDIGCSNAPVICDDGLTCVGGECVGGTCTDGTQNGPETGIDCGGDCTPCDDGEGCLVDTDCANSVCLDETCSPAHCVDNEFNGDESDIDCGGSCPPCDTGQDCKDDDDCISSICLDDGTCAEASCDDGVLNGLETGLDCGGDDCEPCIEGESCAEGSDCESGVCDSDNICAEASCDDGVINGNETDIDCGGDCSGCPFGAQCTEGTDCVSGLCEDAMCLDIEDSPNNDAGSVADGEDQPGDTQSGDSDISSSSDAQNGDSDAITVEGGGFAPDVQYEALSETDDGCNCQATAPARDIPTGGGLIVVLLIGLYLRQRRRALSSMR
ncbi:MAG: MYXO-CTERM sorting domain-containing protein, partial [Myxococcota bacterium]|nr:MYXO-CTERM sorting domain-containing protein [Myxococcota bacterium]